MGHCASPQGSLAAKGSGASILLAVSTSPFKGLTGSIPVLQWFALQHRASDRALD